MRGNGSVVVARQHLSQVVRVRSQDVTCEEFYFDKSGEHVPGTGRGPPVAP